MTRRRTAVPLVALVVAAVLASGCDGPSEVGAPDAATPPVGTTTPADPAPPATAAEPDAGGNLAVLGFVAPDLSGGQVRGADHAGEDVVLWMWAPW